MVPRGPIVPNRLQIGWSPRWFHERQSFRKDCRFSEKTKVPRVPNISEPVASSPNAKCPERWGPVGTDGDGWGWFRLVWCGNRWGLGGMGFPSVLSFSVPAQDGLHRKLRRRLYYLTTSPHSMGLRSDLSGLHRLRCREVCSTLLRFWVS